MKNLFITLLLILGVSVMAQKPAPMPYKQINQTYAGDTTKSILSGDSMSYWTTKDTFVFNKPIKANGKILGSGSIYDTVKTTQNGLASIWDYNRILEWNSSLAKKIKTSDTTWWGKKTTSIPTQLKNYNASQDTVIRLPNLAAGRFGIFLDANSGRVFDINTNTSGGYVGYVAINNGYVNHVSANNLGGYAWYVITNAGKAFNVSDNTGRVLTVGTNYNSGRVLNVGTNYSGGYVGYVENNSGICNTVMNSKSLTPGSHTIISSQVYYDGTRVQYVDSIGLTHNVPPYLSYSAYGGSTTVTLTQNVYQKVGNGSLTGTSKAITYSSDTAVVTYAGIYDYTMKINALNINGKEYIYRVRYKASAGATATTLWSEQYVGAGAGVLRIVGLGGISAAAGARVWVEVTSTNANPGDVTVYGMQIQVRTVSLSL